MNTIFFTSEKEEKYAKACLAFAEKLGLIDDSSLDALKSRCEKENEKRKTALANGEIVYGLKQFTLPVYLDWELTRFKLDFASEKKGINYNYKPIEKAQLKDFYKSNKDLFTRYNGDKFRFKESRDVVYKKIREEEYENEVNNILRKLS